MNEIKSIEKMTFEEALAELEEIVSQINSGKQDLESAINNFERGISLRNHCEKKLNDAKLKIEKITKTTNGDVIIENAEF